MNRVEIKVSDRVNTKEILKGISFVSDDIVDFEIDGKMLYIYCKDDSDMDKIKKKLEIFVKSFIDTRSNSDSEEAYFYNNVCKEYVNTDSIMSGQYIINCGEGMIGLSEKSVELFEYFDNTFKSFAIELGATEERYPVLLSNKTLIDTGYMRTSPQYVHYVNTIKEDMEVLSGVGKVQQSDDYYQVDNQRLCREYNAEMLGHGVGVLSPSACFHVYEHYRNSVIEECKTVTLLQSVFRNEGRFNWKEYGRLRDYHVREIVFMGDEDYVRASLKEMMDKTCIFLEKTGFTGSIVTASDPFVMPNMQKFKLMQLKKRVKYEVRLNYSEEEQISAASFNYHGKAFTHPFNIKVKGKNETVTGCVGYGIERWVLAYLSQFGNVHKESVEV